MTPDLLWVLVGIGAALVSWSVYVARERRMAVGRMERQGGDAPEIVEKISVFPTRYRVAVPLAGVAFLLLMLSVARWPLPYAVAAMVMAMVFAYLIEEVFAVMRTARLEESLVDAIEMLVSSLRSGCSLQTALELARDGSRGHLQTELSILIGRMRIGEDPRSAIQNFAMRVPLESVRLFTHSMAVHWAGGGSLTGALLLIARTVRDRIEVARRIQAQAIESQLSVLIVMGISYGSGFIILNSNPDALREFLLSAVGMWVTVGAVFLQALGILLIWRMSQIRF